MTTNLPSWGGVRLSIITACLDARDDFTSTACSLPDELPSWVEWVVVDGGSVDGTVELAQIDGRVTKFISESDGGVYEAYNKGLSMSVGDFAWFLNAGDTLDDNAFSSLDKIISRLDTSSLHCFNVKMLAKKFTWKPRPDRLLNEMSVPTPGVLFPRTLLISFGGFDDRLKIASDYQMLLKMQLGGVAFCTHDVVLVDYKGGGAVDNL